MRIASFTMIGQFPHGIDIHVRNLCWALGEEDHIFIVTLPEYIRDHSLRNTEQVTFIPFAHEGSECFINFWAGFPSLLKRLKIHPEWFLFMEEDIWFYEKLDIIPQNTKEIMNYLPLQKDYHATMVGDKLLHPRVWEGANLVSGEVVSRAVNEGINFSFAKQFFHQKETGWEEKLGGPISLKYFHNKPDTFDEFSLFCALKEGTTAAHVRRAVHLRGPESLHRQFPNIYLGGTEEDLKIPQEKFNYLCVWAAVAVYYIAGNWKESVHWQKIKQTYQEEFARLSPRAHEWMSEEENQRLLKILKDTNYIKM